MDASIDLFQQNLARWSLLCPSEGDKVKNLSCKKTEFFRNSNGELNLRIHEDGQTHDLYSSNIEEEVQEWFSRLKPDTASVLCIFGVGLGHYYYGAKEWLKQDENHFLLFVEEDIEILHRFLETEMATEIFNDPQVRVFPFNISQEKDYLHDLMLAYIFDEFKFSSLNHYKKDRAESFASNFQYLLQTEKMMIAEHIDFGVHFYNNFFRNIQNLPEKYFGNGLFGKFKGVPAIICGAGPSLEKNIPILKSIKDRALIFGGGTALNALNAFGLQPHFGVGIDPNPAQLVRIASNHGFTVPYFYRNRVLHSALDGVQGDKLFLTGSSGYSISRWFDEKLGLCHQEVSEGANVINFSLSIANALGCDPIICVGVDLAYTKDESYSPGIVGNPIYDRKQDFVTKTKEDELIIRNDIYGNPTKTLWKWTLESMWYSEFALTHPEVTLLNATEGGIGFPNVLNIPLSKLVGTVLQQSFDFESWIHAEIQNHPIPKRITQKEINDLINEQLSSLKKCQDYLIDMCAESRVGLMTLLRGESFKNEKLENLQRKLEEEVAFTYILKDLKDSFNSSSLKRLELATSPFTQIEAPKKEVLEMESVRRSSDFLLKGAVLVYKIISDALNPEHIEESSISEVTPEIPLIADKQKQKVESFYQNGKMRSLQYIKEGVLDGPSLFYSETGKIVAYSTFKNGQREGESKLFYATGQLFARLNFKEGEPEGIQEYFYVDGKLRTVLPYKKGLLDGKVQLFYPNGKLKRELEFSEDKHHGYDRMWNSSEALIQESEYRYDRPVGIARRWFDNGKLQRLVMYDSVTNVYEIHQWDEQGKLLSPEIHKKDDYFDQVTLQTGALSDSLRNVVEHISHLAPLLNEEVLQTIGDDLKNIQKEMENLEKLNQEIKYESGMHADNPKEAIWKSSASRKQVKEKIDDVSQSISTQIEAMREIIKKARKRSDEE